jgi:N-ethylmaleimide reductase
VEGATAGMTSNLFAPVKLGAFVCRNRILMSPMTRARADRDHVPTPIMVDYYSQRAGAGLIISEATGISRQGLGWAYAPGIWSSAQIRGWRAVTSAVHEAGGLIICQLWHMGRLVHPAFNEGQMPVSCSATQAIGRARTYDGPCDYMQARALNLEEINQVVADFSTAARCAIDAGFDGVQLHAASGYLLEQFLRNGTNLRDDKYGGSIENRMRFLMETTEAVCEAISSARVSVRLSPNVIVSGCADTDPIALFSAVAGTLSRFGIAFLELREASPDSPFGIPDTPPLSPMLRQSFKGPLVLNEDYDRTRAAAAIASGRADAISFGRSFIANPDLAERLRLGVPLAADNRSLWYTQGALGYSDYPSSSDARAASPEELIGNDRG